MCVQYIDISDHENYSGRPLRVQRDCSLAIEIAVNSPVFTPTRL